MILHGNCLYIMPTLKAGSFHTSVTSPPYWGLRDYGLPESEWPEVTYTPMPGLPPITVPEWTGCLGLEPTPEMFVAHMVLVFREVWRLLREDGTLWLNFGDSYAGSGKGAWSNNTAQKEVYVAAPGSPQTKIPKTPSGLKAKDLIGIPWRVAFALQADGWYLRMDNIWSKPNPMPESVTDRPTKSHEYLFLLSKQERYYYDHEAVKEHLAESSVARLSQDIENQQGSDRANGGAKTNGKMKAVGKAYSFKRKVNEGNVPGQPKQHREDREDREYYGSRNKRSVWQIDDPLEVWRWLYSRLGEEAYILFADYMAERQEKGSVWTVATAQFKEAHFAVMPEKIAEVGILAGAPVGGRVLDPFGGSGTTEKVALENNRECTIIEMGSQYVEIAKRRTATVQPNLIF
ncbi:site-specific DNA-methyltransferase [Paenibacillus kribbensis]|uniref:DNA-methyltransferase n=1 Tax=Paenibacillus kribbensis TaxID=172713 RepID=UPI002DBEB5BB|nr:site-specific DNA-methyltransferase [Paenibacillus kribbensis]MEC0233706.1 site-specific DNA-methyltransferase [Paenibacillus kribbensis]